MIHRKFIAAAVFTASILGGQIALRAQTETQPETQPATRWTSVANDLGGDKWGFGGVTIMAAVPGSDTVIAGVSECGLWATRDGGKTWAKLGAKDAVAIANHPYQILFDPKNPRTFWESGNTGPGIFRTDDGGESFARVGNIENVDGLGIDFTDTQRQTLVAGLHEQERSTQKSGDGGKTWQIIGDKLPAKTNISNDVLVFDAKTYLVNAAGWKRDGATVLAFGIYRTDDGGKSFSKVSDAGPNGPALVASDGAIYWQTLWNKGLIKSVDNGKTWQPLSGPVMVNPIELPGGKLLAAVDSQLYVSSDAGKSWQPWGGPIPFKPSGLTFSAQTRSLFAWRSTEAKEDFVIARWELP